MMWKIKRTPDDLDALLERDRRDEIRDMQEFTEEALAFLQELRELMEEFN